MPQIEEIRYQLVNADLGAEGQNFLKSKVCEYFDELKAKNPLIDYKAQYILNPDQRPLGSVLLANPRFDLIFSGFNVTRKDVEKTNQASAQALVTEEMGPELQIDPTLRFPAYQELLRLQQRGSFNFKYLYFVGDLNQRIREFLQYGFVLSARFFQDAQRSRRGEVVPLKDISQLPKLGATPEEGKLDLSRISELTLGEIRFHGVVNLLE